MNSPSEKPLLSLIIPVFNELNNLEAVIKNIMAVNFPGVVELVLVDDASTDGSAALVRTLSQQLSQAVPSSEFIFKYHLCPQNQGKGAAIRIGISLASGKIVGINDADFEYDPQDILALIEPIMGNHSDVVYGSRFQKGSSQVKRTYHYLVNRLLTLLSNLLSGIYLTDMETCYKFFRSEVLQSMNLISNRFGFEVEVTAKLGKLKQLRMEELPIRYYPRTQLQGKKINWKDGVAALWHLAYFNLFAS